MIQELHKFFADCPLLGGSEVHVDYLGEQEGSFTIETVPCEPVIKRYYTGGSLRQYCFVIALRCEYGGSPGENMRNEQLCEELAEWAEVCSESANLPVLPAGQTAQQLCVTSGGYMFDESTNHARYQIGMKLIYTQM